MMFEVVPLDLAAILPALTTLYWICLIVGGGLLITSSLAGGDTLHPSLASGRITCASRWPWSPHYGCG